MLETLPKCVCVCVLSRYEFRFKEIKTLHNIVTHSVRLKYDDSHCVCVKIQHKVYLIWDQTLKSESESYKRFFRFVWFVSTVSSVFII